MNIIQTEQTKLESPQKLRLQGYAGKLCCISLWNCSLQRADRQCAPVVAPHSECIKLKISSPGFYPNLGQAQVLREANTRNMMTLQNTVNICSLKQEPAPTLKAERKKLKEKHLKHNLPFFDWAWSLACHNMCKMSVLNSSITGWIDSFAHFVTCY